MKTEMIALSWFGLLCLITATITATVTVVTHDWFMALLAGCLLAYVREDARSSFHSGKWTLGRLFWRRTGDIEE